MVDAKKRFPLIQVALDFTEGERALKVAGEAFKAGISWIEAGTPLIKSEGLSIVRRLKGLFPGARIVADMKVMDTGRLEAEMAFKSGADIVVVLGNASDGTIRESVEAANHYGGEVMVDLMEGAMNVLRARAVEALGASYIGVHIPIDTQMSGRISFGPVREISRAVSVPLVLAGGLNSENIVEGVKSGASILVVGGAITKSPDIPSSVAALQEALKSGRPVKTDLYKRVSGSGLHKILIKVSSSNITDAMHRKGWLRGVYPVLNKPFKMAGRAFTVRTYPGDWAKPVEAIDACQKGDIIVIDAGGVAPAVWGELATNSSLTRKLGGVVIYGGIRDVQEIRDAGFPAFASIICPQAGEPKGFGEVDVPLDIGGLAVCSGDWIVGDSDGVAVIPAGRAADVANRAMDILERENRIRKEIKDGGTLSGITELLRWEKAG